MPALFHRLAAAALLLGLTLLLGACTITSDKPLLTPDEGVTPLPDSFVLYPYSASPDGYVRSTADAASFQRDGNHYVAHDVPGMEQGSLEIRLLPAGDEYLFAASVPGTPATTYGFVRYAGNVLSIEISPSTTTIAALDKERGGAMPKTRKALAGLVISRRISGITIASRATLDYLAALHAAGQLPLGDPAIGYVAEDPDAPLPTRLVQSGDDWIKVP